MLMLVILQMRLKINKKIIENYSQWYSLRSKQKLGNIINYFDNNSVNFKIKSNLSKAYNNNL